MSLPHTLQHVPTIKLKVKHTHQGKSNISRKRGLPQVGGSGMMGVPTEPTMEAPPAGAHLDSSTSQRPISKLQPLGLRASIWELRVEEGLGHSVHRPVLLASLSMLT